MTGVMAIVPVHTTALRPTMPTVGEATTEMISLTADPFPVFKCSFSSRFSMYVTVGRLSTPAKHSRSTLEQGNDEAYLSTDACRLVQCGVCEAGYEPACEAGCI